MYFGVKFVRPLFIHLFIYLLFPALFRWTKEICGMKKILEIFGQIRAEDVKGFRAPYLQPGGDDMFEAMARCGVTYDTSMPAGRCRGFEWYE